MTDPAAKPTEVPVKYFKDFYERLTLAEIEDKVITCDVKMRYPHYERNSHSYLDNGYIGVLIMARHILSTFAELDDEVIADKKHPDHVPVIKLIDIVYNCQPYPWLETYTLNPIIKVLRWLKFTGSLIDSTNNTMVFEKGNLLAEVRPNVGRALTTCGLYPPYPEKHGGMVSCTLTPFEKKVTCYFETDCRPSNPDASIDPSISNVKYAGRVVLKGNDGADGLNGQLRLSAKLDDVPFGKTILPYSQPKIPFSPIKLTPIEASTATFYRWNDDPDHISQWVTYLHDGISYVREIKYERFKSSGIWSVIEVKRWPTETNTPIILEYYAHCDDQGFVLECGDANGMALRQKWSDKKDVEFRAAVPLEYESIDRRDGYHREVITVSRWLHDGVRVYPNHLTSLHQRGASADDPNLTTEVKSTDIYHRVEGITDVDGVDIDVDFYQLINITNTTDHETGKVETLETVSDIWGSIDGPVIYKSKQWSYDDDKAGLVRDRITYKHIKGTNNFKVSNLAIRNRGFVLNFITGKVVSITTGGVTTRCKRDEQGNLIGLSCRMKKWKWCELVR